MLRPSDNPFVTVAGIFLTTVAFVGITKVTDFDILATNIMVIVAGVVMSTQLIVQETNRRAHKRTDALSRLLVLASKER